MTTPAEFRESFERRGKANVIAFIEAGKSRGGVLDDGTLEAIRWLSEVEAKEAAEDSAKRDAREEETLAIARDALSSANEANRLASAANDIARLEAAAASRSARYAMYAAAIAAAGAITANKTEIMQLIFG